MGQVVSGIQNHGCYARAIGGCCAEMSREHYVTEGVLKYIEKGTSEKSPLVRVEGYPFIPSGEMRTLPTDRLKAWILCKNHNMLLSDLGYDQAGIDMFKAMSDLNDAVQARKVIPNGWHVDGDKFERWMLKTLCGGIVSGNFLVKGHPSLKDVQPPIEWLRIIYGGEHFLKRQGLYVFNVPLGETLTLDHKVIRLEVISDQNEPGVYGLMIVLFGFWFVLLTSEIGPGASVEFAKGNYRPAGFAADFVKRQFRKAGYAETETQNRISFSWKVGPMSRYVVANSV